MTTIPVLSRSRKDHDQAFTDRSPCFVATALRRAPRSIAEYDYISDAGRWEQIQERCQGLSDIPSFVAIDEGFLRPQGRYQCLRNLCIICIEKGATVTGRFTDFAFSDLLYRICLESNSSLHNSLKLIERKS